MIKIASFNANSIRSRIDIILDWLKATETHILGIQETKAQDKDFPLEAFKGYNVVFKGQKSYNGVAIISKFPIEEVKTGFDGKGEDEGSRLISGKIKDIYFINTYIPQGFKAGTEKFQYKLNWLKRIHDYYKENFSPKDPIIWVGDFNVAPESIDVYDPVKLNGHPGYHPDEIKGLEEVRNWGFVDIFRKHNRKGDEYTFYDYRIPDAVKRKMGWRLDHIWATKKIADRSSNSYIDIKPRLLNKPSDHTFITAEFDL